MVADGVDGYEDIGEEEDWGVEASKPEEDARKTKKRKEQPEGSKGA